MGARANVEDQKRESINSQLSVRRIRSEGGSAIPLLRHFFKLHEKTLEKIDGEIDSGNFTPLP